MRGEQCTSRNSHSCYGGLLYGIFWVLMKKGITNAKKIYQSWIFGMLLSLEITVIFAMTLYGRAIGTEK